MPLSHFHKIFLKTLHQNLIDQNDKTLAIQIKQVEIQIKTVQAWLNFNQNYIEEFEYIGFEYATHTLYRY